MEREGEGIALGKSIVKNSNPNRWVKSTNGWAHPWHWESMKVPTRMLTITSKYHDVW